jgi:hypothetical protein
MTIRIILILAIAIMIGPSRAYSSPACMTKSEARAKFPKAHLYWHGSERCWNDSAAFNSRALPAVPAPSFRPAQAAVPVPALEFGVPLETIRRALLDDSAQAAVPAPSLRPALPAVPAPSLRPAQAAVPVPSLRSALAAVPVPLPRPAPTAVLMSSPRPVSTTEGSGSQCRYSPCE